MAERCASSEGEATRTPFSSAQASTGSCRVWAYCAMSSMPSSASMPTEVVMPWKSWNGKVTISKRRASGRDVGVYSVRGGESVVSYHTNQPGNGGADAPEGRRPPRTAHADPREGCDLLYPPM